MRARWRRRSTKTSCSPATDARTRCSRRCSRALLAFRERFSPAFATSFTPASSRPSARTVVVSGEYIWKYTHNAFDFSVLGNTPITFPIDWHNSKIPGYALRRRGAEGPQLQRLRRHVFGGRALLSAAGRRCRRYVGRRGLPFRIDHDEKFNQTTHLQYTVLRAKSDRPSGADSTGATTPAWLQVQCLATT